MNRSLALLARAVALPAAAQIHPCVGGRTPTYSDSDCPAAPSTRTAPPTAHDPAAIRGVPDAPLEIVETGVPAILQMPGKFVWLDDDTLAITTFSDPPADVPWMVRRVVAFDMPTRAVRTLVPRGFIDCNNANGLVSLEIGDLLSRFAVGSRSAPSVQQFQAWNAASHTLGPAPDDLKAGWHPSACLKPAPEDLATHDLLGSHKPVRYLQPEHGVLTWGRLDASGHPEGPALQTPRKRIPLALGLNDISHEVRYLPFRHAYQLSPGEHDRAMDPVKDADLVTMDTDGRVTRRALPAALTRQLDAAGAPTRAEMIAVRPGELVIQPGASANGGGFYLVQGEQSRRVWCTATPARGLAGGAQACTMTQAVAVSPNGCRIAFDAKPAGAPPKGVPTATTIKVISLCEASALPAEPTAAGHGRHGH